MKHRIRKTSGLLKSTLAIVLVIGAILVGGPMYWNNSSDSARGTTDTELTFAAVRGEFVSSITESGDVESSSNVEIRCRVRERGGTAILDIVDEGTMVQQGDLLVQLDDAPMRDELIEQKIRVATDRADVIQAQSDLDTAKRSLTEFKNGVYQQELATYQAENAFAKEALRRAKDYQGYSENLARKGYVTKAQLEADQFAVIKAEKELALSESKLAVYQDFTHDRMISELQAEIKKQEANQEASQYTLELSQQRLNYYEQQVAACRITAPEAGQVVYANEIDGRGDSGIVIEEGINVREGQPIIRLPDPSRMQVNAKVNDSKINAVRVGQLALIHLDTAPETPLQGSVSKIAAFPLPRRWSQAPIEYEVFVEITEQSDLVRPGLRAKAEIFIQKIPDVVQAPVSALIDKNNSYYVVVKNEGRHELRPVKIGPNNQSMVVILEGLEKGEQVLVDPDAYRESQEKQPGGDT